MGLHWAGIFSNYLQISGTHDNISSKQTRKSSDFAQSVIFSRGKSYKNQAKTIKSCLSVSGSMFTYNIGLLIC